jgi:pyruvate dehydrogenase E1 component alpha subunit
MTTFADEMVQLLREDGTPTAPVPDGLTVERLLDALRWMKVARVYDRRAISLQRQGKSATYASMEGQEAALVGSAFALDRRRDWMVPQYRETVALAIHGFTLARFFLYLRGHPAGGAVPEGVNVLPVQISVGTQITHAVGLAWGLKLQGREAAVVAYFGDGATSEGSFHEGATFAGVTGAPVIFFCQNNGWAISTPRHKQNAAARIADKAAGYGIAGVQVDGNDLFAVYRVVREAAERARAGGGPTLIEAMTYRMGAHTTADDPTRYVPVEELELHRQRDPIRRLELYLERLGVLSAERLGQIDAEAEAVVAEAYAESEAEPDPADDGFFNHVYADPPARLREQRAEFNRLRHGITGEAAR